MAGTLEVPALFLKCIHKCLIMRSIASSSILLYYITRVVTAQAQLSVADKKSIVFHFTCSRNNFVIKNWNSNVRLYKQNI